MRLIKVAIVDDDVDFSKNLQKSVENFMSTLFSKYEIDIINNNFASNH